MEAFFSGLNTIATLRHTRRHTEMDLENPLDSSAKPKRKRKKTHLCILPVSPSQSLVVIFRTPTDTIRIARPYLVVLRLALRNTKLQAGGSERGESLYGVGVAISDAPHRGAVSIEEQSEESERFVAFRRGEPSGDHLHRRLQR